MGGCCCCACGGFGDGVGVTTGAGEAEASTTLSTGGGESGREPGTGDELLKTGKAKTRSIIEVPQRKSDESILRRTKIKINDDFTYLLIKSFIRVYTYLFVKGLTKK